MAVAVGVTYVGVAVALDLGVVVAVVTGRAVADGVAPRACVREENVPSDSTISPSKTDNTKRASLMRTDTSL